MIVPPFTRIQEEIELIKADIILKFQPRRFFLQLRRKLWAFFHQYLISRANSRKKINKGILLTANSGYNFSASFMFRCNHSSPIKNPHFSLLDSIHQILALDLLYNGSYKLSANFTLVITTIDSFENDKRNSFPTILEWFTLPRRQPQLRADM